MKKLNSKITTKYISEAGSAPVNKDYFGFVEMDNFACWAVAESYDNDKDIISAQLAVDTVLDLFTKKPTLSKRKLRAYIKEAHWQLQQQSSKYHLKASILLVATDYTHIRYALCGNSRLHIFRGSGIFHKSQDQSLYQDMIAQGQVPDDGEKGIEESRNLFDYLGKMGRIRVQVSKKIVLQDEDILLLTTWGFWEKISTIEMLDALEDSKSPLEYLDELQDLFLSKQGEFVNIYTLATVFAHKTFKKKNNTKKIIKIVLVVAIVLLIIGIILFIYFSNANKKRKSVLSSVTQHEQQGDMYIEDENYDRALTEYDSGLTEAKGLKETKGKKGEENTELKGRITAKQRVAQLIVDSDALFQSGKYAEARLSYEKALKEAKYDLDFYDLMEIENVEAKVSLCDDYSYVQKLVGLADSQAELEDYDGALSNYEEARKLARSSNNKDAEKEIKLKMDAILSQLKAEESAQAAAKQEQAEKALEEKISYGALVELDGDKAVTEENYDMALGYYNQAIALYKETASYDKASQVETKIIEMNTKIKQQEADVQLTVADGHVKSGDDYMLDSLYDDAISAYKLGKDIYSQLKAADKLLEVNAKISLANDKKKELENALKLREAEKVEKEGDELLQQNHFVQAKVKYQQAQVLYQNINQLEKVLSVEKKIVVVDDMQKILSASAKVEPDDPDN